MSEYYEFDLNKSINYKDLFGAFGSKKEVIKMLHYRGMSARCYKKLGNVFNAFLELVIEDIIENNTSFKFPSNKECYLELRYVDSEEFKHFRFRNMFPGADPIRMKFHCVEMTLRHYSKKKAKWCYTSVIVGRKYKKMILENIYKGKY